MIYRCNYLPNVSCEDRYHELFSVELDFQLVENRWLSQMLMHS